MKEWWRYAKWRETGHSGHEREMDRAWLKALARCIMHYTWIVSIIRYADLSRPFVARGKEKSEGIFTNSASFKLVANLYSLPIVHHLPREIHAVREASSRIPLNHSRQTSSTVAGNIDVLEYRDYTRSILNFASNICKRVQFTLPVLSSRYSQSRRESRSKRNRKREKDFWCATYAQ